jgi:fatty-acyl-CoA synthase
MRPAFATVTPERERLWHHVTAASIDRYFLPTGRNPAVGYAREKKQGSTRMSSTTTMASDKPALVPTPSDDALPRRYSDFATVGEALDYAAQGTRGLNFHDARGKLARPYPYRELRDDALAMARRLMAAGVRPGDRLALVAETCPEFAALFFGCIYAAALPVPLPLPTSFGGRGAYVDQLAVQIDSCDPTMLIYPGSIAEMGAEAATRCGVTGVDWDEFITRDAPEAALPSASTDDIAYLQYSSGSTRFPHGVAVTHHALLNNLAAHSYGMHVQTGDRCVSWLPWYHDMGLVGCFLSPIANQVSVDYLKTEDFARRPLAWLDLISRNPGTTLSYSPTFGYEICSRRVSTQTHAADRFDLSRWRVAGNGADMIRPDVMQRFVDTFADCGFQASAFLPSYGLAEATLAVSIMPPGEGIVVELVEETELSGGDALRDRPQRYRAIVNCGKAVRDMTIEIRDDGGNILPDRQIGKVWCSGPSLMVGYFRDDAATDACMVDGWLDTGDMGYLSDGYIYIVGRAKDMIIINGKNHWPQDIEWAVEQLPGFKAGDIAAFAITAPGGEETPAVLVQCRTSDPAERKRLHDEIRERVRAITGMNCIIELVPPRTLPRTSSGKLSRSKARNLYLTGEIQPYDLAA